MCSTASTSLSAKSDSRSQAMTSRAVTKSGRLFWKVLIEVYGNEEMLQKRIKELRESKLDDCDEVL